MSAAISLEARSAAQDRAAFSVAFAEAQDHLRSGPYRVGVLPVALGRRFAELPLPFPAEFWIAAGPGGEPLGRICASLSPFYAGTGYLGLFEAASPEAARLLLDQAERWLALQGATRIFGPVAFNTWFPYRLRLPEPAQLDDGLHFAWEPLNPPEYPEYFEQAGYSVAETYQTLGIGALEGMLERSRADYERALSLGYKIRPMERAHLLDGQLPILHRISMESFSKNFLFEPIPLEIFRELYVPLADKADLSLACFILGPEGKELGFTFNFPDSEYIVLKTFAVLPEARGLGLSNALMHSALAEAQARGIRKTISALVKTGLQSESYTKAEAPIWSHEYALYRKDIQQ